MYCNKCGSNVAEGTKFCPTCGNDLSAAQNEQVVAEQPTANVETNVNEGMVNNVAQPAMPETVEQPVNNAEQPTPVKEDKANIGLAILSWFIPLAGLIIFIVQKDKSPKTAKVSGICALISFLLNLLVVVLSFVFVIGSIGIMGNKIENTANEIINEAMEEIEEVEDQMDNDLNDYDYYDDYVGSDVDVSKNWKNYEVGINGKTYKLPMTYQELSTATGFKMEDEDLEMTLKDDYYASVNFYKNGKLALYTEITNNTGAMIKYPEGKITRISQTKYQSSTNKAEKVIFPGGLKVEDPITESELIVLFGQPNDKKTYGTRTIYSYYEDDTWTTRDNYKITVVDGIIDEIQLDNRSALA